MSIWSSISLVCLVFGVVLGVVLHDLFHPLVIGHAVLAIVFCMLSLRRSESSPEVPNRDRRLPGAHWAVFAVMMA
ncbi:MAG: hypothetical protein KDD62_09070, partial [Bdellovibrionales bacterium]|nr:hypothetical protein [Bdellovibrionales bacterium]